MGPGDKRRDDSGGGGGVGERPTGDAAAVDLPVHPDNDPAQSLYGSLGFKASKRDENFLGDGEPRVIMVRRRGP